MVTTRRASANINSTYEPAVGGVSVLERPVSYAEYTAETTDTCSEENALRMRNNLNKLLNYDRFSETVVDEVACPVETQVETNQITTNILNDEDIRPTSTTMQFGDDIDGITREMNLAFEGEKEEQGYHLNKKGKIVVLLYSLVVAVILALIVINTGVLASLTNTSTAKAEELSSTMAKYDTLKGELDSLSSPENIIDRAQQDLGMIFPN